MHTEHDSLRIISYDARYNGDFRRLNEAWICEHFELEETDRKVLNWPQQYVIDSGGEILFAVDGTLVVGTCALVKMDDGPFDYELVKMAVDPLYRRRGIGRKLTESILDRARALGAKRRLSGK